MERRLLNSTHARRTVGQTDKADARLNGELTVRGLIVEGVAGTGKSTVLARLVNHPRLIARHPRCHLIAEQRTTGELVQELADPALSDVDRCSRIERLMPEIRERLSGGNFVLLERFHLTFYALMPHWDLVSELDEILASESFVSVLLDLPDYRLAERSFHRPEMASQGWSAGLTSFYGSQTNALAAFARSQAHRRDALAMSKIPTTILDTSAKDWDAIVDAIVDLCV